MRTYLLNCSPQAEHVRIRLEGPWPRAELPELLRDIVDLWETHGRLPVLIDLRGMEDSPSVLEDYQHAGQFAEAGFRKLGRVAFLDSEDRRDANEFLETASFNRGLTFGFFYADDIRALDWLLSRQDDPRLASGSEEAAAEEQFEILDEHGNPAGLAARSRVHREGLWHRAANVFLFRSDGRLLLQRRQSDKDVWPGAWDLSAAEHLKPGETYEEAALRGLHEELGIEGVLVEPLGDVAASRVEVPEAGVRDYELQQCFRAVYDGPVAPDPIEVAAIGSITLPELTAAFAERPEEFTPWFRERVVDLGLLAPG